MLSTSGTLVTPSPLDTPDPTRTCTATSSSEPLRIGIDIGGTTMEGVALDGCGALVRRVRRLTVPGVEPVVETAAQIVTDLRRAMRTQTAAVPSSVHVGVGIPGLVDSTRGTVTGAVNLGFGHEVPFADLLARRVGIDQVAVENDVNAASLGVASHLSPRQDVVLISIGTGLAAGAVLDGRLHHGRHRAAGEIGHLSIDPGGMFCGCGQRGCLETIVSGPALRRCWPTEDGQHPGAALFAAAADGDEHACDIVGRFCHALGLAVHVLTLTFDPSVIALGGGVSGIGQPLLQALRGELQLYAAQSPFLASLAPADRLLLVPTDVPVGALGAAHLDTQVTRQDTDPRPFQVEAEA